MTDKILFSLIASSFKHNKITFECDNELELTRNIIENGLVGLLFQSMDKSSFKVPKYHQMLSDAFGAFVSKDIQQMNLIDQIKTIFNEHQIKHIFLKGSHLKMLYPESYMRGMGDIDVLVLKQDFKKAQDALKQNQFKYVSATSHHHGFESIEGIDVELHQSIISSNEYENEAFLKDVWLHTTQLDKFTYGLKPEFEYVYLLTHLIRHIRTSGVGIRSLLDMYVFYESKKNLIDETLLNRYLIENNLDKFNTKVKHLNQIFLIEVKPSELDLVIIDYIRFSGIHGKGLKHDMYLTKRTHEQTRLKKSKLGFFLSEVFPSKDRIKESYPYLKKHPWLLPWAWFVRILKQVFKVKNTKKRLKSISNDDEVDSVKGVYDYLGI